jgi:hypothetical protein
MSLTTWCFAEFDETALKNHDIGVNMDLYSIRLSQHTFVDFQ